MKIRRVSTEAARKSVGDGLLGEVAEGCWWNYINQNGVTTASLAHKEVLGKRDEGAEIGGVHGPVVVRGQALHARPGFVACLESPGAPQQVTAGVSSVVPSQAPEAPALEGEAAGSWMRIG